MPASIWETARASQQWPLLGILEDHYRKITPRDGVDGCEGPAVVRGTLRRMGELLAVDGRHRGEALCLQCGSTLVLLDESKLHGQHAYALGVVQRLPSPRGRFASYRDSPELPLLHDGWLMDDASWSFYRAGPLRRAVYRLLGFTLVLADAIRGGLADSRRAAAAVAVAVIALSLVSVTGLLILQSKRELAQSLRTLVPPPAAMLEMPAAHPICAPNMQFCRTVLLSRAVDPASGGSPFEAREGLERGLSTVGGGGNY